MKVIFLIFAVILKSQISCAERVNIAEELKHNQSSLGEKIEAGKASLKVRTLTADSLGKAQQSLLGRSDRTLAFQQLKLQAAQICQTQKAKEADLKNIVFSKESSSNFATQSENFFVRATADLSCLDKKGRQLPVPSELKVTYSISADTLNVLVKKQTEQHRIEASK